MRFVRSLDQISKRDIKLAGGKGANLGELAKAGFNVPDGFVITTSAFSRVMKENGLVQKVAKLARLDFKNHGSVDLVAGNIRESIVNARISLDIKTDIISAYSKLDVGAVAVRSSATAEDLKSASFAGQQSTYLNIKGEKALLSAVKRCWASLFNTHAIYYRNARSVSQTQSSIAVVVQMMINSKKAGVMFTINPVTMNRDETVIEAAFGQGELVVNGSISPDMYTVDKLHDKVSKIVVNHKNFALYLSNSGTAKKRLDNNAAQKQVLSKKEILSLAKIAKRIENHYKFPQDIEWAIAGKIYILQSRPITTAGS